MKDTYMTVETTNLIGSVCYSMQSESDIPNGAIVGKGDLIDKEDSIYKAEEDYSKGMYLVANPAWDYDDSRAVNQNEEYFTNKAGRAFRVYKLQKDHVFKLGNLGLTKESDFKEKDKIEYKSGKWAKASGESAFVVEKVEEVGFPYCVGVYGAKLDGDDDNKYGYAIDGRQKKYTVRVDADVIKTLGE